MFTLTYSIKPSVLELFFPLDTIYKGTIIKVIELECEKPNEPKITEFVINTMYIMDNKFNQKSIVKIFANSSKNSDT